MKTLGEKRVRTDFNVTSDDVVQILKNKGAEFIDLVGTIKHDVIAKYAQMDKPSFDSAFSELFRLVSIAQTEIETATMYAVKAATFKPE